MQFDEKQKQMLKHYAKLFEEFVFDEYDIMGFLMVVREEIRKENSYPFILEFADLIAHRKRNRGLIAKAIKAAIDNNYETYDGGCVKGYQGIDETRWKEEWKKLLPELNIAVNKRLLDEITICICSLANGSNYDDEAGHAGIVRLGFSKNKIALTTTEGKKDSLYVTFFVYSGLVLNVDAKYDYAKWIGETVRENGVLRMKDEYGNYIF